jgi:hypothetical protein
MADEHALAMQARVRELGMCGDLSPDGARVCVQPSGHGPHHWIERQVIVMQWQPYQSTDLRSVAALNERLAQRLISMLHVPDTDVEGIKIVVNGDVRHEQNWIEWT